MSDPTLKRVKQGLMRYHSFGICNSHSLLVLELCTVRLSVRTLPFQGSKTGSIPVPCTKRSSVTGYSDPEDEKCLDKHGWFQSNQTGAGNATTDPVEERVEDKHSDASFSVMREHGLLKIYYNYRRGSSEHS